MASLDRRRFIGSSLAFSSVGGFAGAATLLRADTLRNTRTVIPLVICRATLAEGRAFAAAFANAGMPAIPFADDIVRQWRDDLAAQLLLEQRLLVGFGNWDDYLLISGLARESRRQPLLTMQHPLSRQRPGWAANHAEELLTLLSGAVNDDNAQAALSALVRRADLALGTPSLFSWVVG